MRAGHPLHRACGANCEAACLNGAWPKTQVKAALAGAAPRGYGRRVTDPMPPDDCTTMAEVRAGVDAIDRALGALLASRFGYMRAAARIKPSRGQVRDEGRKTEVIDNAVADARAGGWPEPVAAALWETLVEASIAYELERFDALR